MSKQQSRKAVPKKEATVRTRIDIDLKEKAELKAMSRGWTLGTLLRAWIKAFAEGDDDFVTPADVGAASARAPHPSRKLPPPTKDKGSAE